MIFENYFSDKIQDRKEGLSWSYNVLNGEKFISVVFAKEMKKNTIGCTESKVICEAFRCATKRKLPIVIFVSSGGIRITEGTLALMQMVNIIEAVKRHSDKGLLYIAVIVNTTLGGASASFVSLADIIIGKKGAIYGFSGKRIIEKTTKEIMPDDFQTVEYARKHGMVDIVAEETEIVQILSKLLFLHKK